jgi:hypothetical protein
MCNKIPLILLSTFFLSACQTRHAITLEFSPATLCGGSREKEWKEAGFHLVSPSDGKTVSMVSMSKECSAKTNSLHRFWPFNGTDYLEFVPSIVGDVNIQKGNMESFTPVSIDIAEYSTLFSFSKPFFFYGTKSDGSIVAGAFVIDGIIDGPGGKPDFETFHFPKSFSKIIKLSWCTQSFAIDNLIIEK